MATNDYYKKFNKIQTYFFTSINKFNTITDYDINEYAFVLFNNITKAFPSTGKKYMIYNDFCKINSCPSLIRALQHKFVNRYSSNRIPQAIFFKTPKKIKKQTTKKSQVKSNLLDFNPEVIAVIQNKLMLDNKTYEEVKYTDKIQELGSHIADQIERKIKKLILKN